MNATLRDKIEDTLKTVYDPEIPVNIYDLGLVYQILIGNNNSVNITMTLTAPACPVAPQIIFDTENKIKAIEGVGDVHVHLTFEPPWSKDMMSEEARIELGL